MSGQGAGPIALVLVLSAGSCIAPGVRPVDAAIPMPAPGVRSTPAQASNSTSGIRIEGKPTQGGLLRGQLTGGAFALSLDGVPVASAADGAFIIGFGEDAAANAQLRATLPDGRAIVLPLAVAPRAWRTETIASLPRFAQPSAEFARLRAPELAAINAARRTAATSQGWQQRFIWPVTGRVSGVFGSRRVYANGGQGAPHSGVDVARPTGTPIVAPADGVVTLVTDLPFTLEGNLLLIDHGMGLNSAFLHLSRIDVRTGDRVRQGQPIGAVGATGRASGPHLHWGMKWRDRRIDPQPLAGAMVTR